MKPITHALSSTRRAVVAGLATVGLAVGGMIAITWLLIRAFQGVFGPEYYGPVDYVGLYWHLVDMIWIYLFPLLYLLGRHAH